MPQICSAIWLGDTVSLDLVMVVLPPSFLKRNRGLRFYHFLNLLTFEMSFLVTFCTLNHLLLSKKISICRFNRFVYLLFVKFLGCFFLKQICLSGTDVNGHFVNTIFVHLNKVTERVNKFNEISIIGRENYYPLPFLLLLIDHTFLFPYNFRKQQ